MSIIVVADSICIYLLFNEHYGYLPLAYFWYFFFTFVLKLQTVTDIIVAPCSFADLQGLLGSWIYLGAMVCRTLCSSWMYADLLSLITFIERNITIISHNSYVIVAWVLEFNWRQYLWCSCLKSKELAGWGGPFGAILVSSWEVSY
jgi:hypothetical protein